MTQVESLVGLLAECEVLADRIRRGDFVRLPSNKALIPLSETLVLTSLTPSILG